MLKCTDNIKIIHKFYGAPIVRKFYNAIFSIYRRRIFRGASDKDLFMVNDFIALKSENFFEITTFNDQFIKYISKIDLVGLQKIVNDFYKQFEGSNNWKIIISTKLYLYTTLIDGPLQLVENLIEISKKTNTVEYFGVKTNRVYKIIKEIKNFNNIKIIITPVYIIIGITNYILIFLKDVFLNVINIGILTPKKYDGINKELPKNIIVINILESRRFEKIYKIINALESMEYQVVLFSACAKKETLEIYRKYPELSNKIILDADLLNQKEISKLIVKNKSCTNRIFNDLITTQKYKGVKIISHYLSEVTKMLSHRNLQSEISNASINKLMKISNILGYIGFDGSISNAAWMNLCKERSIPTFFYFYNNFEDPIYYKIMHDCFKPTYWLLSKNAQMQRFLSLTDINQSEINIKVVGDIVGDDSTKGSKPFSLRGLNFFTDDQILKRKTIVLISSYINYDFTYDIKESFFKKVYEASKKLNVNLAIKPHPNESIKKLNEHIKYWGIDAPVLDKITLSDVLPCADLLCMYFSESAQAAFREGIPVISVCPGNLIDAFDCQWNYFSSGAVAHLDINDNSITMIEDLIFNKFKREAQINRAKKYFSDKCISNNVQAEIEISKIVDMTIKNYSNRHRFDPMVN